MTLLNKVVLVTGANDRDRDGIGQGGSLPQRRRTVPLRQASGERQGSVVISRRLRLRSHHGSAGRDADRFVRKNLP